MTIKFEKLDQILRKNAGTLFEKEIEDDMFLDFAISLKTMPLEEMTKRSWSLPESDLDEESDYEEEPVLPELLIKYLEKEADEELQRVIDSRIYFWHVKPNTAAHLFQQFGLGLDQAIDTVKVNYYSEFYRDNQTNILINDDQTNSNNSSIEVYSFEQEETKRDLFLLELSKLFTK